MIVKVLEAIEGQPNRYLVRVLREGRSVNGNTYPQEALRRAVKDKVFEGVRVFVKSDDEHLDGKGRSVNNLIGRLTEAVFVTGSPGELQAVLEVLESAGNIGEKIREAVEKKLTDLFGLSIDADVVFAQPKTARVVERFVRINSLDVIVEPSAGGGFISVQESIREESKPMLVDQMIAAIQARNPALLEGMDQTQEEKVLEAYNRAMYPAPIDINTVVEGVKQQMEAKLALSMRVFEAKGLIQQSHLPDPAKERLAKQFDGQRDFTIDQVREAITSEADYLAKVSPTHVQGLGGQHISGGESQAEKTAQMWDDFFSSKAGCIQSVRECYIQTTGDRGLTGKVREAVRLREAVDTSSFDQVLGDAVTRRLLADYAKPKGRYNIWRNLAKVVPVNDFRTQHRTRMGGYGNLSSVSEGDAYQPMTSPTDEEATYAVTKRGGTEEVTLEAIANDDVGAIRQIPIRLSNAAQRTLAQFVLDFIRTNPTLYDLTAWFHADHGNLGSTALSAATLAAARLAVLKMTEAGSSERLGIPPVNLWVPFDLEETAFDLFRKTTNNDADFVEAMQMKVIPVWYWTDANDWAVSCDPDEIPFLEVGFFGGREEPELFTQDSPTSGSLFTHDKITYKLRHIYGGAVTNYRGAYKAVVA